MAFAKNMTMMNLTSKLQKPPETIYMYLTDMQRFASVHPVISKIEPMDRNAYLVHETLKFLGIPVSFTYTVTVEKQEKPFRVVIRAKVMKVTHIEMTFDLIPDLQGTLVQERVSFSSPLPVKQAMQRIFKKQHAQLFKNIDAEMRKEG